MRPASAQQLDRCAVLVQPGLALAARLPWNVHGSCKLYLPVLRSWVLHRRRAIYKVGVCLLLAGARVASYVDEQELHRWGVRAVPPHACSTSPCNMQHAQITAICACACSAALHNAYTDIMCMCGAALWCSPVVDVPFLKEEGSNHLEGGYALVSVWRGLQVRCSRAEGCTALAVLCSCNVTSGKCSCCQRCYCCAQLVLPCSLVDCPSTCCWLQHLRYCE
jgi:hypothetical protein